MTTGKPLMGKDRTKGLSLPATDVEFAWGEGPEVVGPGIDSILAATGRVGALDHLEGDGAATLLSRC